MIVTHVRIWPLDPVTGNRVEVRFTAHADGSIGRKINSAGDMHWEPALAQQPQLRIMLFDGAFASDIAPGQASFEINLGVARNTWPGIDYYAWAGAKIEIRAGAVEAAWPRALVFAGKIATYARKAQKLSISAQVDTEPFVADVLSRTYAGNGGSEGPADLKDRAKPLVLGHAKNVEPVLIDAVNSVYQFSGYGPIEEVTTLFERGSDFGTTPTDHADYTALVAATIAPGHWDTCLAEGMIRLGAPQYGVITGDIKGHKVGSATPRLTGAIITALADIAGVDPALIASDSLDAIDGAVPFPINLVLNDQVTFIEAAQSLCLPLNAQGGIGLTGQFFAARIDLGREPTITLDAQGRASPQVSDAREEYVRPPFWRTVMGAERSWRVHTSDEIASDAAGNGAPRHEPAAGTLSFTANHTGAIDAEQLPKNLVLRRYNGIVEVTADATWSIVSQGSITGGTVTVTNGVATIPTGCVIPLSTTIQVKSVLSGFEIITPVAVTRIDAAAPTSGSGGGTTVSDNTLNSVSNTTKVALSDIMTVKTGSSGQIDFAGTLSIIAAAASPAGTFGADLRWKWRAVGGSFADVGASDLTEAAGAVVFHDTELGIYISEDGLISAAATKTGLTASTDYEVQLWGARDSASPTKTISFGGSVSATGS